jgi:hypothetical protein
LRKGEASINQIHREVRKAERDIETEEKHKKITFESTLALQYEHSIKIFHTPNV